ILAEENKTDLVQRIKKFSQYDGCRENDDILENLETTKQNIVNIDSIVFSYYLEVSDIFDKNLQTLREL
ncbi:16478_t:CDS:1, partial [Racocetra persica]